MKKEPQSNTKRKRNTNKATKDNKTNKKSSTTAAATATPTPTSLPSVSSASSTTTKVITAKPETVCALKTTSINVSSVSQNEQINEKKPVNNDNCSIPVSNNNDKSSDMKSIESDTSDTDISESSLCIDIEDSKPEIIVSKFNDIEKKSKVDLLNCLAPVITTTTTTTPVIPIVTTNSKTGENVKTDLQAPISQFNVQNQTTQNQLKILPTPVVEITVSKLELAPPLTILTTKEQQNIKAPKEKENISISPNSFYNPFKCHDISKPELQKSSKDSSEVEKAQNQSQTQQKEQSQTQQQQQQTKEQQDDVNNSKDSVDSADDSSDSSSVPMLKPLMMDLNVVPV